MELCAVMAFLGFPGNTGGKEPSCQCRSYERCGFDPRVWKIPRRRAVFTSGESHGQSSLAGFGPQGCTESDITEGT